MSHTDEGFEKVQDERDLYRGIIMDSTEAIGWRIEILTKVVDASKAGTLGSFSPADQYQAKQTLMYLKSRKSENAQFRKAGDSEPRTFAQYNEY